MCHDVPASVVIEKMIATILLSAALLQSQKALFFEVASVRPCPATTGSDYEDGRRAGMSRAGVKLTGTRATGTWLTVKQLIGQAYTLKDHQMVLPAWTDKEHFDIAATLPAGATAADLPVMLQGLLAERFALTSHREEREQAVLALVVEKLKMPEAADATPPPSAATEANSKARAEVGASSGGSAGASAGPVSAVGRVGTAAAGSAHIRRPSIDTAGIVEILTRFADLPILDLTGLTGKYQMDLTFALQDSADAPSIYTAVKEQLGLKLDRRKIKMEVLVADHLDQSPKEN
jgi:uncharacterized protein (TIGR03435 family)